ncbi:MAG: hypothetical protein APF81_25530 [Desulfosporosinus sp. BRH_c37]|nr:MAG: hypothetical protein APF81_25530 [Desulfosporosinus sp. BRH_c37]
MIELKGTDIFGQTPWQGKVNLLAGMSELIDQFLEKNMFVLEATLGCVLVLRKGSGQGEVISAFRGMTSGKTVDLLQNKKTPIIAQMPSFVESYFFSEGVFTMESEDAQILRDLLPFYSGSEKFALCALWQFDAPLLIIFWGCRPYEEKDKVFLETSTWLLATAFTKIHEHWESSVRLTMLERVFDTTKVLTSEQPIEDKLGLLACTAIEMLHGNYATVRLVQRETLQLATFRGFPVGFEKVVKENFGLSIDDWTVRKGKTVTIEDITSWPAIEFERQANGLKSVVSVPMRLKHRVIGAVSIYSIVPQIPSPETLNCLLVIADQAAIVIEDALLMSRSALLQEVHHRVKNNLQMVAGLLSLAATSNQQSPLVKEYLQESVNRVKTMAIIHGLLSEKGEGLTDLKELINRLAPLFLNLQLTNTRKVEIKVKGPTVFLGSKEATCLALAINELFCNSLMHGIVDFREGFVTVEIIVGKDNLLMKIQDNGQGFPPGFDWRKQKGLGLKIVEALVEKDLRGTFKLVSNHEGALAVLVVPKSILSNGGVISGTD